MQFDWMPWSLRAHDVNTGLRFRQTPKNEVDETLIHQGVAEIKRIGHLTRKNGFCTSKTVFQVSIEACGPFVC